MPRGDRSERGTSRVAAQGVSARAARVEALNRELNSAYRDRDGTKAGEDRWRVAADAFDAAYREFYAPYEQVLAGVRAGETDAIEEATRFLVADPWCFRSGYLKADLMHALANSALPSHVVKPLREVVLNRITNRQPRLLRLAAQLASNVWDADLEIEVRALETRGNEDDRAAAASLIAAVDQRRRSLAGQPSAGPGT